MGNLFCLCRPACMCGCMCICVRVLCGCMGTCVRVHCVWMHIQEEQYLLAHGFHGSYLCGWFPYKVFLDVRVRLVAREFVIWIQEPGRYMLKLTLKGGGPQVFVCGWWRLRSLFCFVLFCRGKKKCFLCLRQTLSLLLFTKSSQDHLNSGF